MATFAILLDETEKCFRRERGLQIVLKLFHGMLVNIEAGSHMINHK